MKRWTKNIRSPSAGFTGSTFRCCSDDLERAADLLSNWSIASGLSHTLLTFFPERFFQALGIPYHLAKGMSLHFFFMWFFVINGVLYVAYTFISGEWRYLAPNRHSFREAIRAALHDLNLSKIEPPPRKFNGAQQIAYTTVILMGAGSLSPESPFPAGSVRLADVAARRLSMGALGALWLAAGCVIFFVIHFLQVVKAAGTTSRHDHRL
jgi:thiosulfate reductase cytochrome b subunit